MTSGKSPSRLSRFGSPGPIRLGTSLAFCAAVVCHPAAALACLQVPDKARISAEALIDKAQGIYLARVVSAVLVVPTDDSAPGAAGRPMAALNSDNGSVMDLGDGTRQTRATPADDRVDYRFSVVETISGPEREGLTLQFKFLQQRHESQFSDFHSHNDEGFWTHPQGRTQIRKDCSITPVFEVGHTYLVFPDAYHMNGYELILDPDDKWLRFVRERRQKAAQEE